MENALSTTPNPFAEPMDPQELAKLLVSLMPVEEHRYVIQLRLLELHQASIEKDDGGLVPYRSGVSEFIDGALKPLIEGQPMPTTWLEASKILTKAKDYHPARAATFYAYGWPEAFGDVPE